MQDLHVNLNPGLSRQKQHSAGRRSFSELIGLTFEEETNKVPKFGAQHFMVLKPGHLGRYIGSTCKVLKCDAGE